MKTADMIDGGRFAGVINHLKTNPDIHTAIQVNEGMELHEVGDIFVDGNPEQLQKLLAEKKIEIWGKNEGDGLKIFGKEIDQRQAVHLLYLPPFYLFKDLNKEWK